MNDDITVREIELVAAILNALNWHWISMQPFGDQADGYIAGFTDAMDVIGDVLDERGFDENYPEQYVPEE